MNNLFLFHNQSPEAPVAMYSWDSKDTNVFIRFNSFCWLVELSDDSLPAPDEKESDAEKNKNKSNGSKSENKSSDMKYPLTRGTKKQAEKSPKSEE